MTPAEVALAAVVRALAPTLSEYEARAIAQGLLREFVLTQKAPGGP